MSANIKEAIEEFGIVEFSCWMLNDGRFLGVGNGDDHRIVGNFCTRSWLDFIKAECVSIHYDHKAKYLWIRINCDLNFQQRQSLQELYENKIIDVEELYIQIYDNDKYFGDETMNDKELIKLYLTDLIAYRLTKQYENQ